MEEHLEVRVDGDGLVIDLLLFHVEQLRDTVVKIGRLRLADADQLGTYVALVNDRRRSPRSCCPVAVSPSVSRRR